MKLNERGYATLAAAVKLLEGEHASVRSVESEASATSETEVVTFDIGDDTVRISVIRRQRDEI